MEECIGKICPFCKMEIKEGDSVKVCPACGIPHHEGCWEENKGCTTFGCSEQHYEAQHTNPTDVCRNCGTPLDGPQAFCPICGTLKSAPQKNVCGKCGAELQESQEFCPKCGQKAGLVVDAGVNSAISQFNAGLEKKKKKKSKLPFLIGGIAAAVILAVVLLLRGPSVDDIVLSSSTVELRVGDTTSVSYTISPAKAADANVHWKSSNTSVATVSSTGKITGKGDGSCTITATAGGKSDSLKVTVKTGPDLKALYREYCSSTWASIGSDGSYLKIDTNPYDWDDDGLAYPDAYYAIGYINTELGLPDYLLDEMAETRGADGKQSESFDDVTISWSYHPDRGLEVTYRLNH